MAQQKRKDSPLASVELCPVSVVGHKEAVYTGFRLWLFSGARLRICAAQILHVFQPYIFSLRPVIDPLCGRQPSGMLHAALASLLIMT